ncbi:MAG TPA: acetylornithine/succinylornithine family transaminase [Chitinivibrionales bacterium]
MKKIDYNTFFVPTFSRTGAALVKGKGVYLYDADGKKYLDFGTGIAVNALGHAHPALVKALTDQANKLIHTSNLYITEPHIELAKLLVENSFGKKVFLCNSGTEAIEAAIKFSRKFASRKSKKKYHILSFFNGFHGRTYGALSATAQEKFHKGFGPLLEGFHYAHLNDVKGTKKILDKHKFAAIIVEPVQGEGGIHCAETGFLRFLRDYATKNDIVLVFDEIQCGMGRTGTLWNYEQHKVIPDLMAIAKPLGGGLPLGGLICNEKVALSIEPGNHGTTFGGNPIACALGCEVLKIVSNKAFLKNVIHLGAYLQGKLQVLAEKYPIIKDVRGEGLLVGAELKTDPKEYVVKCKNKGLIVISAGSNTLRFLPPLIVTKKEIDKALSIFESCLK